MQFVVNGLISQLDGREANIRVCASEMDIE